MVFCSYDFNVESVNGIMGSLDFKIGQFCFDFYYEVDFK